MNDRDSLWFEHLVTVLVVDDEVFMREYLRHILEQIGFLVIEAADGMQCVSMARANPPDILITDIIMPNKEGLETIRDIKKRFLPVAIFAMSGGGKCSGVSFHGAELWARTHFCKKPFPGHSSKR